MTRRSLFGAFLAALLAPLARWFGRKPFRLVGHLSEREWLDTLAKSALGAPPRKLYRASPAAQVVQIQFDGVGQGSIVWRGRVVGEIERDELRSDLVVRNEWDED